MLAIEGTLEAMRRFFWIIATVSVLGFAVGCGGPKESQTPASADPGSTSTPASNTTTSVKNQDPSQAVTAFLEALRSGDDQVAEALLTTRAREETARHNLTVQPPGTPNATYQVGRVEYPDKQQGTAYVECRWTERYKDGTEDAFDVVWVMRFEQAGWHVAGMATQLGDTEDVVMLDFENPQEMLEKVRQAESVASRPETTPPASTVTPAIR